MLFSRVGRLVCLSLFSFSLATASPTFHQNSHNEKFYQDLAARGQTPKLSFDELWNLTTSFWDAFMYPANNKQVAMVNSTIFAENVQGRVDVTRTFVGRQLNTEYLFGLFSLLDLNPNYFTLLGVPMDYNITHFAAVDNVVACTVTIDFAFATLGGFHLPNEIDLWMTFNGKKRLSQYDMTFRWLDWELATLLDIGKNLFHVNDTAVVETQVAQLLAKSICTTASLNCNGTNQQYDSDADCMAFLTQDVRFGYGYELGMNTLLCRMVHQDMVPFNPTVHCPHIGPTGGAYCVDDLQYASVVTQPFFTKSPFVPRGKQNADPTIAEE